MAKCSVRIILIIVIHISNCQKGYGLTETTSGFCRAVGEEESARIGSVGPLLWGAEVKIVHPETGAALPPGVPGELWVRGPFVMKGSRSIHNHALMSLYMIQTFSISVLILLVYIMMMPVLARLCRCHPDIN
jgi:non-ribosomal peptide synthetase component E (peptide arylation enzyme)